MATTDFETFRALLLSQPISSVWRGHGSAVFLEVGALTPSIRQDGRTGHSDGDFSIMIEWSWRIENKASIVCGSWSDEAKWENALQSLIGQTIENVSLFGRLPELSFHLSGDLHVTSFMTSDGQPAWAIIDHRQIPDNLGTISVKAGRLHTDRSCD